MLKILHPDPVLSGRLANAQGWSMSVSPVPWCAMPRSSNIPPPPLFGAFLLSIWFLVVDSYLLGGGGAGTNVRVGVVLWLVPGAAESLISSRILQAFMFRLKSGYHCCIFCPTCLTVFLSFRFRSHLSVQNTNIALHY